MAQSEAGYLFTLHAQMRCHQRGITADMHAFLLANGDREVHCGGGCVAISLSRKRADQLRKCGTPGAVLERLDGMTAVVAGDRYVVTVLRATNRRYRREWN